MNKRRIITIGTDPEYFMKNTATSTLVSAIPFIKGGKHDPEKLPSGGNLQSDNVAVEFATPPARTSEDFIENLKTTIYETSQKLPEGFELAVLPSAQFDPKELEDPKACQFGCDPDYCAWELKMNEPPVLDDPTFRSCGGHIHIGCLDENGELTHKDAEFLLDPYGKIDMVRGMDLFHGIISTILDNSKAAIERRKLYGKAGCHRSTEYGVEYRALSNYWTKTPYSSMLMSSLADDVIELIISGKMEDLIEQVGGDEIRRIINTGDTVAAKRLLDEVLYQHLSEDSRFYLNECLTKLGNEHNLLKSWQLTA